jgi:hypothetical protein
MKFLLISLAFLVLSMSVMLCAQTNRCTVVYPQGIDRFQEILLASNRWDLTIARDGSGSLRYDATPSVSANFPKQTFSFKIVYELLTPHLLRETYQSVTGPITVFLIPIGPPEGVPSCVFNLNDRAIAQKIFSQALAKAVPTEPTRFNELLAKYPPVPPDETK